MSSFGGPINCTKYLTRRFVYVFDLIIFILYSGRYQNTFTTAKNKKKFNNKITDRTVEIVIINFFSSEQILNL